MTNREVLYAESRDMGKADKIKNDKLMREGEVGKIFKNETEMVNKLNLNKEVDNVEKYDSVKSFEVAELANVIGGMEKAKATLRINEIAKEEEYENPVSKEQVKAAREKINEIYNNAGHKIEQPGSGREAKKHLVPKSSEMMDIEQ